MNFLKTLGGGEAAAGSGDAAGAGGGWLASLKEKSKELAEVYKRDLGVDMVHDRARVPPRVCRHGRSCRARAACAAPRSAPAGSRRLRARRRLWR